MSQQSLETSGEFLRLSRQHPELFSSPTTFNVKDNQSRVTIFAPGIICFEPTIDHGGDKDIVLSAGVHGNETAPIEICDTLVQRIIQGQLSVAHRVLFLFANLPAMDIAQRFVQEDINRLFSGAHSENPGLVNYERKRAKQLEQAIEGFFQAAASGRRRRYHYDLHTASRASKNEKFAVYPFLHGKPRSVEQTRFMAACGVNTILLSETPATTFSYFSSNTFGAHALTVELGIVRPFGQNDMSRFEATRATMERLLSELELELPNFDPDSIYIYRVNQIITKHHGDFEFTFPDETPNFTDYPKGHVLAREQGKDYVTEHDGEAIVFPNANVALGQRALLTVIPARLDEA